MGDFVLASDRVIPYIPPQRWVHYDRDLVFQALVDAKSSIQSLTTIPYQRDWVDKLQEIQLKMEVAGTSRIEGAEFTERELDAALDPGQSAEQLITRSQRQARTAAETYRWIATLPDDRAVTEDLALEIHRRMVTGCDDDHCPPGRLRLRDENVTFGFPRHRGCEGGPPCQKAFSAMIAALRDEFRRHDPLIQAIALHYHFAAMHPFLDGNGRTARALEALLLQRAGLRDTAFIAMSNYYYEEKSAYLAILATVRLRDHDLTEFINFGLRGVAQQCQRLFGEIKVRIQAAVFRNVMYDLFNRLESPKKRVIAKRQLGVLRELLEVPELEMNDLVKRTAAMYSSLKNPLKALLRDLGELMELGAVNRPVPEGKRFRLSINLDWPEQITEGDFMDRIKNLPKGKGYSFLSLP